MQFYVYTGTETLGNEKLGTEGKCIWRDLKTTHGAIRRAKRFFGDKPLKIYTFRNFYLNDTFRLIYEQ